MPTYARAENEISNKNYPLGYHLAFCIGRARDAPKGIFLSSFHNVYVHMHVH